MSLWYNIVWQSIIIIIIIIITTATPLEYDRVEKPLNTLYDMHTHFFYTSPSKNLYEKFGGRAAFIKYTKIDIYIYNVLYRPAIIGHVFGRSIGG